MGASMRLSEVAREALRLQRQLLQEPSLRRNRAHGQRLVRVGLQRHSGAKAQGGQQHGSVVTCEGILKKPGRETSHLPSLPWVVCFLSFFVLQVLPMAMRHNSRRVAHSVSEKNTGGGGVAETQEASARAEGRGAGRPREPLCRPHHAPPSRARRTPHPHHARVPHDGHRRRSARGPWSTWPVRLGRARQKGGWSGPSENARSR